MAWTRDNGDHDDDKSGRSARNMNAGVCSEQINSLILVKSRSCDALTTTLYFVVHSITDDRRQASGICHGTTDVSLVPHRCGHMAYKVNMTLILTYHVAAFLSQTGNSSNSRGHDIHRLD